MSRTYFDAFATGEAFFSADWSGRSRGANKAIRYVSF
jgi:hypothetical protein